MGLNIEKESAVLNRLTVDQLRSRYAELFGETTRARHKTWLTKRILWRMQAMAEGDLSERAFQRAQELACEADLRLSPPKAKPDSEVVQVQTAAPRCERSRLPLPGTVISRAYKGGVVQLKVLSDGFEYEGEKFGSLSAVAKRITGSHVNGFQFFRLSQHGGDR